MRRLIPCLLMLSALSFLLLPAHAEESPTSQELRELRQTVQQQSKQIELLAEQIGRLTRALEGQKPPELPPATTSIEAPKPLAEPTPEAPKVEPVPKAEPAVGGAKHVVAKGETLTSIAKQYNIPVAELKNANKIENERKLQIGQILTVPTAKPPETADKKENP
jgi:LysM repeat protein